MNLKRAFLILIAVMFLPGVALAQEFSIGITATVDFADSNDDEVLTVDFSCNDGSNPVGQAMLGDGDSFRHPNDGMAASFVCTVTASSVDNYTFTYNEGDGCEFTADDFGAEATSGEVDCAIEGTPETASVEVTKIWNLEGAGGNDVDTSAVIEARAANGVLVDGDDCAPAVMGSECVYLQLEGLEDDDTVLVNAVAQGVSVTFREVNNDSSVEVTNDCGTIEDITPGAEEECSFTNTVFFEGIPTLSQYGLAIMALLMLGVGFVGFRRFV